MPTMVTDSFTPLRAIACDFALSQNHVVVHATARDGVGPCLSIGRIVAVTDRFVFITRKNGDEFGIPLDHVIRIDRLGAPAAGQAAAAEET